MNWYKIAKNTEQEIIFYHGTVPDFAEEIVASGYIKPSSQLHQSYQGWNFRSLGHNYGEAIFLAKGDEKELAVYYAETRLRKLWEKQENMDDLFSEDLRYIALFTVHVKPNSPLLRKSKDPGEYHYFGYISKNSQDDAYWTGPEWISCEKEADKYIEGIERLYNEEKQLRKKAEQMEFNLSPEEKPPIIPESLPPIVESKNFPPIKGENMPYYAATHKRGRIYEIKPVWAKNPKQAMALFFKFNEKFLKNILLPTLSKDDGIYPIMDQKLWNRVQQIKEIEKEKEENRQKNLENQWHWK